MKMKVRVLIFFLFGLSLLSCDNSSNQYQVENYYNNTSSRDTFLLDILPYIAKLDRGVTYDNRFSPDKRWYFKGELSKFNFERYYITKDSIHYFLIWKVAPSLYVKKIAIGGRFKKDKSGKVYEFEELFNTPKMKLEEGLKEKSYMLFDEMVSQGNINKYAADRALVDFPDERCVYDKSDSRWKLLHEINKK